LSCWVTQLEVDPRFLCLIKHACDSGNAGFIQAGMGKTPYSLRALNSITFQGGRLLQLGIKANLYEHAKRIET
jgi:hypothetical protein